MTPYEIQITLEIHNAQAQHEIERRETLAWMIGAYVGIGVNNGKRYPTKPSLFKADKASKQAITPDQMKANLFNALGIKSPKDVSHDADNA